MFSVVEHQANARNESKKDKQIIEELETEIDDLAETLCTSKIIIMSCSTFPVILCKQVTQQSVVFIGFNT